MNLNAPYTHQIKLDLPEFHATGNSATTPCYADLVFLSVYKLIHNGPRLLKPIYKSIIAILSNIAPYTKKLSREACDGLMYLIQVFSKKDFLLEKEDNCKSVTSLFEAVNYLVAYHDETNQYLQIQLMKYQTMFDYFDAPDFETKITQGLRQAAQLTIVPEASTIDTTIAKGNLEDSKVPESADEIPDIKTHSIQEEPTSNGGDVVQHPHEVSPFKSQQQEVIIDKKVGGPQEEEKVHVLVSEENTQSPRKVHEMSSDHVKTSDAKVIDEDDNDGWER